ncbi:hypothetical protein N9Q93_00645 [bacterium]|nr:hypothetical protein [bacterium]MDB4298038.1 hypothetical protein [bacterium]
MSEVKQEGDFKIKSKKKSPKKLGNQSNEPIKVNIDEVKENITEDTAKVIIPEVKEESEAQEEVVIVGETKTEEQAQDGLIEVIEESEDDAEPIIEQQAQPVVDQRVLPENIEKLVSFMEDTGGTVEDYVRLNADYSSIDDKALLKEYYKKTKPYLESDDVSLLLEDYDYDEDLDEEKDIRKKKIAFKEEVAKAKGFLENTKSKYYDEIKLRPGATQEQQKATEFFNRYQEDQKVAEQQHTDFKSKTNDYFTKEFKGFDFNVGEKKFRYGLQDPSKVAENQSSINNFVGKFLDDSGNIKDTKGYHKAIYLASNADKIINHFYEQGKTDATKEIISKSKNPSTEPRQTGTGEFVNGIKVKSISGYDNSKLRIKTKKFN